MGANPATLSPASHARPLSFGPCLLCGAAIGTACETCLLGLSKPQGKSGHMGLDHGAVAARLLLPLAFDCISALKGKVQAGPQMHGPRAGQHPAGLLP